jgi:hypothetical protein
MDGERVLIDVGFSWPSERMSETELIAPWLVEEDAPSADPESRVQLAAAGLHIQPLTLPFTTESWFDDTARVHAEQDAAEAELSDYLADVRRADAKRPEWTKLEIAPEQLPIRINLVVR